MRIRPMTEEDLPRVAALEACCFSRPWTESMLRESLEDPKYVFFVAETEIGETAGYAGMYAVLDEGNTTNVAVFPEFRKMGAGELLTRALLDCAREKKLSILFLEVRESNVPAIRLYEKCGFKQIAVRKDYYEEPRENARIYGETLC